jgi:hypothetical protein
MVREVTHHGLSVTMLGLFKMVTSGSDSGREERGGRGGEVIQLLSLLWMPLFVLTFDPAAEWEEMCIVAVSDKIAKAMEMGVFQQLLASLSLQPPSEQVRGVCVSGHQCNPHSWFPSPCLLPSPPPFYLLLPTLPLPSYPLSLPLPPSPALPPPPMILPGAVLAHPSLNVSGGADSSCQCSSKQHCC